MSPAAKEILQQLFGKDFFTGNDLGGIVPRTEHAAESLVSPYGTAAQMTRPDSDPHAPARTPGRMALDTIIGGENTSELTEKGKKYGAYRRKKQAEHAEEKPRGPLDRAYYGAKDVLGLTPEPDEPKAKKKARDPNAPKKSHHNKEKGY
jgi:hypothetical protein